MLTIHDDNYISNNLFQKNPANATNNFWKFCQRNKQYKKRNLSATCKLKFKMKNYLFSGPMEMEMKLGGVMMMKLGEGEVMMMDLGEVITV